MPRSNVKDVDSVDNFFTNEIGWISSARRVGLHELHSAFIGEASVSCVASPCWQR